MYLHKLLCFFIIIQRPPISPPFPYTTLFQSCGPGSAPAPPAGPEPPESEAAFLDDVQQRTFRFFWERANPANGLVPEDRKSTRLNSSHANKSYAVFCLKKKIQLDTTTTVVIY